MQRYKCVPTEEDPEKFVCKCDGDCKECEDDLDCEENEILWKTTCDLETHKCVCPPDMIENASGKCVYCWKEDDISHGCAKDSPYSECNELANEGFGKCVCPPLPEHGEPCNETCGCKDTENEECNPVSLTCECAGDSFWDNTLKRCIDCLGEGRNFCSNLEGSCPTVENPVCNSDYECEACPDNQSWICDTQICSQTYKKDQVIYESCKKNKKKKCLSPTCGGNGVSKKGLKLYPGRYAIVAIGAGGGVGYDKNGTGSHNRSGAASGGGGG